MAVGREALLLRETTKVLVDRRAVGDEAAATVIAGHEHRLTGAGGRQQRIGLARGDLADQPDRLQEIEHAVDAIWRQALIRIQVQSIGQLVRPERRIGLPSARGTVARRLVSCVPLPREAASAWARTSLQPTGARCTGMSGDPQPAVQAIALNDCVR